MPTVDGYQGNIGHMPPVAPQEEYGTILRSDASQDNFFDFVSRTKWSQTYAGTNRTRINSSGLLETVAANTVVIDHVGTALEPMLRVEPAAANILLGAPPVTQDLTLPIGSYSLQVLGAGTATPSALTATITGEAAASTGVPNTFAVTVAGTVRITIATATVVWLCPGAIPSSYFAGAAAIGAELVVGGAFTAHTTGAVTLANMRISAVDGTSFVDFTAADVLTDHLGKILTLKDSTGKVLVGYIKAAGTGETLGTELLTLWQNSGLDTLTPNVNAHDIDSLIDADAGGTAYRYPFTIGAGVLTKSVHTLTGTVAASLRIYAGDNSGLDTGFAPVALSSGANTYYWMQIIGGTTGNYQIVTTGASNFSSASSYKTVLTPSATGVTIVSTPGGATYNWKYKEAGFNFNDAGNYTYEIYDTDFEYGTGWYPSSNTAVKIAGTASALTQTTTPAEATNIYRIGHTAVRTAGTYTAEFGSTNGTAVAANGLYYDYIIAADTDYIKFNADATFAGSIDLATGMKHGTVRASEAGTITLAMPAAVTAALADTGTLVVDWMPSFARAAGVVTGILSADGNTASLLYTTTTAGNLSSNDGMVVAASTAAYTANVLHRLVTQWPSDTNKYKVGASVAMAGIAYGAEAAYDGSITAGANLVLAPAIHGTMWYKSIKIFNSLKTDAQINGMR